MRLLLVLNWGAWAAEEFPSQDRPKAVEKSRQPEVWLRAGDRIADLLDPEAEWSFVKQHLTGIKFYIGQLSGPRGESPELTLDRLRKYVHLVKAHNLQVAVKRGGCLDFSPLDDTAGEWSARCKLTAIDTFYATGGKVDFLDLDGPIRRLLHPHNRRDGRSFDSIENAADELVDALQIHRRAHAEVKHWLLTNFPNWGYRGDVSYPFPKRMVPESAPHSMTALVKAVIQRVRPETTNIVPKR
jgi:hypothetical protein